MTQASLRDALFEQALARRSFLLGGLGGGCALFLGSLPFHVRPLLAQSPPALHVGGLPFQAFMDLSTRVTGHEDLDPELGERLFRAFWEAGHVPGLRALYDAIASSGGSAEDLAAAASARDAAAKTLLRGWYVGLVRQPDGSNRLIDYEEVLMGAVLADFIALRSFCGGEPHFWAEPPELADLPL